MYLKKMTWLCALLALAVTIGGVFDASMVEGKTKKETAKNATVKEEICCDTDAEDGYSSEDLKYLAAITYCEAGNQSYAGMMGVGIVVLNRVRSEAFPNTILAVLKQRCQFTPVGTGKFAKEVRNVENGKYRKGARRLCMKAAQEVLEGQRVVNYKGRKLSLKSYHFFSQRLSGARLRIGGHDFK